MRLFGKVDNAINRYERASWITCPFDLALTTATTVHPIMVAGLVSATGFAAGATSVSGLAKGHMSTSGLETGQVI